MRMKVKGWGNDRTLLVLGTDDPTPLNLERAIRNLPNAHIIHARDLSVYDSLWWKRIILDVEAVQYFTEWLGKERDLDEISQPLDFPPLG
jgi:large subunit ribosomal protein L4